MMTSRHSSGIEFEDTATKIGRLGRDNMEYEMVSAPVVEFFFPARNELGLDIPMDNVNADEQGSSKKKTKKAYSQI